MSVDPLIEEIVATPGLSHWQKVVLGCIAEEIGDSGCDGCILTDQQIADECVMPQPAVWLELAALHVAGLIQLRSVPGGISRMFYIVPQLPIGNKDWSVN